jgi:hypothetical protein
LKEDEDRFRHDAKVQTANKIERRTIGKSSNSREQQPQSSTACMQQHGHFDNNKSADQLGRKHPEIQRSIYHSRRTEERTAKAEDTPTELFRLRTKASTNSTYFTPRKKPHSCTLWYSVTETIGKK